MPVDVFVAIYEDMQDDVEQGLRLARSALFRYSASSSSRASRASGNIFGRWQAHLGISFAFLSLLVKFAVLITLTSPLARVPVGVIGRIGGDGEDGSMDNLDQADFFHYTNGSPRRPDESGPRRALWRRTVRRLRLHHLHVVGQHWTRVGARVLFADRGERAWLGVGVCHLQRLRYHRDAQRTLQYRRMMDELNYFARDKRLPAR